MKITKILFLLCVATLVACAGKKSDATGSQSTDNPIDSIEPTAYIVEKVAYSDSIKVGVASAVSECNIAYLKSDTPDTPLIEGVNAWIRDMMQDAPRDIEVGLPLAQKVVNDALEENEPDLQSLNEFAIENGENFARAAYELSYSVEPIELAPRYVTMMFTSYIYLGGAHGATYRIGQTISAIDGKWLDDIDIFKEGTDTKVLALVEKGLMEQYFEVKTKQELVDILLLDGNKLPLPSTSPYFTDKGVTFLYQQYEIASYASGMPECTIPFEDLKPYFTDEARALIADKL